jgi:hypothetical protein
MIAGKKLNRSCRKTKIAGKYLRTVAHSVRKVFIPLRVNVQMSCQVGMGIAQSMAKSPRQATPMQQHDGNQVVPDPRKVEETLLERARDLSRKAEKKLHELLDDTKDKAALPADPTEEVPPVL